MNCSASSAQTSPVERSNRVPIFGSGRLPDELLQAVEIPGFLCGCPALQLLELLPFLGPLRIRHLERARTEVVLLSLQPGASKL